MYCADEGDQRAEKNFWTPHLLLTWGHETEHCICFIIVIMTSKRLPAQWPV